MSTYFIKDEKEPEKKSQRKTWDEQIFSNFKLGTMGEVEEYKDWFDRLAEDENLQIPEEFIGPNGVKMHKLLKKYPLLGQEYEVVTNTCTDVMLKQIDEDGYIGHVYLSEDTKKVKHVQIYGHKDFLIKK